MCVLYLMIVRAPETTLAYTCFPYTELFRENARRSARRSPRHPRSAADRVAASAFLLLRRGRAFGRFAALAFLHPLAGDDIIDHLGDVGRMVAHALEILGDEQQEIGRAHV